MRYIKISSGNNFNGINYFNEYLLADVDDSELDKYCTFAARSNANLYENVVSDYQIYRDQYRTDEEFNIAIEEAIENYYSQAWAKWEEITKEEYEENI